MKLAKGEALTEKPVITNNGFKDVPSYFLDPIPVDKSNLVDTVIKDGFQKLEEVYGTCPRTSGPRSVNNLFSFHIWRFESSTGTF